MTKTHQKHITQNRKLKFKYQNMTNLEFKDIRWKQRFENYKKALAQLQVGLKIEKPSQIEEQGIIKSFEFTFELGWKTMKDYLESQGLEVNFPREVIKTAFEYELIQNGEAWLSMLDKRNLLSHVYDQKQALIALTLISKEFIQNLEELQKTLMTKINE